MMKPLALTRIRRFIGWATAFATSAVAAVAISSPACADTAGNRFSSENLNLAIGGLAWYALLVCVCGILISAAMWAMGAKDQNSGIQLIGKKGIIVCCTTAFFVGALPGLVNWLNDQAATADTAGLMNQKAYSNSQLQTISASEWSPFIDEQEEQSGQWRYHPR